MAAVEKAVGRIEDERIAEVGKVVEVVERIEDMTLEVVERLAAVVLALVPVLAPSELTGRMAEGVRAGRKVP